MFTRFATETMFFLGQYPSLPPARGREGVKCSKTFKLGKDTLSKYIKLGIPFKGKLYSRTKLHKE